MHIGDQGDKIKKGVPVLIFSLCPFEIFKIFSPSGSMGQYDFKSYLNI